MAEMLQETKDPVVRASIAGLEALLVSDSETFLSWLDVHRCTLDQFFLSDLGQHWAAFASSQNRATSDRAHDILKKRKESLKHRAARSSRRAEIISKYEVTSSR